MKFLMKIVLATLCEIEMRDKGLRGRHLSEMLKNSSERKSKSLNRVVVALGMKRRKQMGQGVGQSGGS